MLRSLVAIIAAIHLSNPSLSTSTQRRYAELFREEARRRRFDPYTGVAIAWHESRVRSSLVARFGDEEYVGLGQIRLRNYAACREDLGSPGCGAQRQALLDPATNIRAMGAAIQANRRLAVKRCGAAPYDRWLAGYQGFGVTCAGAKPPRMTRRVMAYRSYLAREVPRKLRGLPNRRFR